MAVVTYGPERGLSGHPVTALAQDRQGRLWAGTWGGGVLRYDGLEWRPITSRDGLLSDRVIGLVPGSRGEMWVSSAAAPGSAGGLTVIQGERVQPIEGHRWRTTTGLETRDSTVWLALAGGGLARWAADVLEPVAGLDRVDVLALAESSDGRLWLMGRPHGGDPTRPGTLHVVEGGVPRALGTGDGLPAAPFRALLAARDGAVWLATEAGLYRRLGARFEAAVVSGASVARPLWALSEDALGRLWLGAAGAVVLLEHDRAIELRLPAELGEAAVLAVGASPSGGVFLATSGHLLRLEGRAAEVLPLEPRSSLVSAGREQEALELEAALDAIAEHERMLLVDHEGGTWAIAGRHIVRYGGDEARRFGREEGLGNEDVRSLLIDGRGLVWAGTATGLARLDPANGYFEPVSGLRGAVDALYQDRGGMIYAAAGGGVYRLNGLLAEPWEPASAARGTVALASDAEGNLWLGSRNGLDRVTADGLEHFGSAQGLASSPVLTLRDIEGELWAGHEAGLSHRVEAGFEHLPAFDGVRVQGIVVEVRDGERRILAVTPRGLLLAPGAVPAFGAIERTAATSAWLDARGTLWQGLELGLLASAEGAEVLLAGGALPAEPARAFAEDSDGRVWIATRRGLYRHAPRRRPPTVWIEELRIGGEPASGLGATIRAERECRTLELRWGGVSFVGPRDGADLRFETRLLPVEKAWSPASTRRGRTLTGLSPERYTFEVRAVSRDLVRSEPARQEVIVGRDEELPEPPRLVLPDLARP